MEFLTENLIETTTSIVVGSNTSTAENILKRDPTFQYVTSGFDDDNTTASLTINFSFTTTVNRIGLTGINLKNFTIFYNGSTANTFALTTTGSTNASSFTTNSETAMYLRFSDTQVTSITLDMRSTITPNSEKAIGFLVIGENQLTLERMPNASGYTPILDPEEIVHNFSDGGTRVHFIDDKWKVSLDLVHISAEERSSLKALYLRKSEIVFVPFGTMTSWDEIMFEGVWIGPFEFYKYSDDAVSSGFEGKIRLAEVPT